MNSALSLHLKSRLKQLLKLIESNEGAGSEVIALLLGMWMDFPVINSYLLIYYRTLLPRTESNLFKFL